MSQSSESFEVIGSRKRNLREGTGSCYSKRGMEDIAFICSQSSSPPVEGSAQLTSISFPVSCEESNTSVSNDHAEIESDTASENHSVSSFGSKYQHSPKTHARKRKRADRNSDTSCFLKQGNHAMGQSFAEHQLHQSNVWNDSSWILSPWKSENEKEKNNSSPAISTSTKDTRSSIVCSRSKHCKVQGLLFAAAEDFESVVWEDTHWHLPSVSSIRKIQMRMETRHCSTEKESNTGPSSPLLFPKHLHVGFTNVIKNQSQRGNWPSAVDSPSTLYRWLRARLVTGLVRSSFDFLHRLLKRYYDDVQEVVKKLEDNKTQQDALSSLESLRDRLAGIWCVYAHFTLEVGCLALAKAKETNESSSTISKAQNEISFDDYFNLAISVLLKAQDCRLVGNHAAIGISLGRLIVSSTVMKDLKHDCLEVRLSHEAVVKNIRLAIDACWDSIDVCRLRGLKTRRFMVQPIETKVIFSLSNFVLKCEEPNFKNEIGIHTWDGIESTLLLPKTVGSSLPAVSSLSKSMEIVSRDTICSLCQELNRWSRLAEKLEKNSKDSVRITPHSDTEISFAAEELPLYAPLESLSDPLDHYKDVVTLGKEIIWQW